MKSVFRHIKGKESCQKVCKANKRSVRTKKDKAAVGS